MQQRIRIAVLGVAAAAVCFLAAGRAEAAKLGVVDTGRVVKEYEKTQESQTRLEKEFEDRKSELKKMNDSLEKKQEALSNKKGIVSADKYQKLQDEFTQEQDAFREKYKEIQAEFLKKQRDLMESIVNDIRGIVENIAKKEKLDAVLDKDVVLYGGEDVTYKVLDALNRGGK